MQHGPRGLGQCIPQRGVLHLSAKIPRGDTALTEPAAEQQADRWMTRGLVVVLGYLLLGAAIYFAAKHGYFDPGPRSGKSDNVLLGPFNILVIASGETNAHGSFATFAMFSFLFLPALLASFGGSGCWPWFARFAVLGLWALADFFAWLVSIPLE
jgi:hypothetical protein